MPAFYPGQILYRNYDHEFEKQLSKSTAERKIPVVIEFLENPFGFTLTMTDETGARIMVTEKQQKEVARRDQTDNIRIQLSKIGNIPFQVAEIKISMDANWFIPSSLLATMRRKAIDRLLKVRLICYKRELFKPVIPQDKITFPEQKLTYLGNVSNSKARLFYKQYGVNDMEDAFELSPQKKVPLMFTKHCLRYSMGWCPVWQKQKSPYQEPFYLLYKDIRLRVQFDCKACQMLIWQDEPIKTYK